MRVCRSGPHPWKRFISGKALGTSVSIASKQSSSRLLFSLSTSFLPWRSFARSNALVKVSSVNASSLPMARFHMVPRLRGGIPRHHNSRIRGSRRARSQFGYTYSSQMFCSVARVLSFSHCAFASLAALRFSEIPIRSPTILYGSCLAHTNFSRLGHHLLILL